MPGFFSQATLEQVRAASDIVDVIGGYIPLKRNGANFGALCPFHKEKTPSFNVNPHKQIFYCFGCHKGGDVFTFVKDYENIGFADAVRRLADRAHIVLETENNPGAQQARHIKDTLLQIHEQITQRWQTALANDAGGQIARDYLAKRGVSEEAQKLFRLGYAPDAWDDTVNWAKGKNYDSATMEQGGLIIRKDERFYDRFRGRLIFPICDEQGRVIGFSGRILSGDEKTAKYINSPETPIFTKGKVLFGLDKAKRSILEIGCVVVCEGQLDTISCHSRGMTHVVAPQGTALTAQHVRVLQRYTDDLILCFDSDTAGRKAAARGFDELVALGVPFRVAEIPSPEDPDSFLKKFGRDAFLQLIIKSRDFFDWYLDYLAQTHDPKTDRGRLAIISGMSELLFHPKNRVLYDVYTQRTAMRLGVSINSVLSEFDKFLRRQNNLKDYPAEETVETELKTPPSLQEITLLKLLFHDDDNVEWVRDTLNLDWISHPRVAEIISRRFTLQNSGKWCGVAAFLTQLENDASRQLVTQVLTDGNSMSEPEKILKGVMSKPGVVEFLRDKFIERRFATLNQQMGNPDLPENELHALWKKKQDLVELKKKPFDRLQ